MVIKKRRLFIVIFLVVLSCVLGVLFICKNIEKQLPRELTRVDYIESNGKNYVKTDYYPNQKTDFYIEFENIGTLGEINNIFGTMKNNKEPAMNTYRFYYNSSQNNYCFLDGKFNKTSVINGVDDKRYIISSNVQRDSLIVNEEEYEIEGGKYTFTAEYPLYIFTSDRGTVSSDNSIIRLYSLVFKEGNRTKLNLIPCITNDIYIDCEGNTVNAGMYGLFDSISGKFYTSSTNIFFSGADPDGYNLELISYKETDNSACIIYSTNIGTLYLPSSADYSNMDGRLIVPDGAILRGTVNNESITAGKDELDLTRVFGEMLSGIAYTLTIEYEGTTSEFKLVKSEIIADIYIESDTKLEVLNLDKENTGSGRFTMIDNGETLEVGLKKIKGRGNSSWKNTNKKGYNITLESKKVLIDGIKKQKKYCLINCGNIKSDTSFLNNMTSYTLYNQICKNNDAISWRMVNLYVNGEYLGLYMLTEKVMIDDEIVNIAETDYEEGNSIRFVDSYGINDTENMLLSMGIHDFQYSEDTVVTEMGGYLIEAGSYYDEIGKFTTSYGNKWCIKEPEYVSLEQLAEIATYVQRVEDALYSDTAYNSQGEYYADLLDLDSLARTYLVNAFNENTDFMATSDFFYIDRNENGLTGKMISGPIWDMNAYKFDDNLYNSKQKAGAYGWIEELLRHGDFTTKLYEINKSEFSSLVTNMADVSDENNSLKLFYEQSSYARLVNDMRWSLNSSKKAEAYLDGFVTRIECWNALWSDTTNALRGVTVECKDGTLIANAIGADEYQWYCLGDDYTGKILNGALEASYIPLESGNYYVVVSGSALKGSQAQNMVSNVIYYEK